MHSLHSTTWLEDKIKFWVQIQNVFTDICPSPQPRTSSTLGPNKDDQRSLLHHRERKMRNKKKVRWRRGAASLHLISSRSSNLISRILIRLFLLPPVERDTLMHRADVVYRPLTSTQSVDSRKSHLTPTTLWGVCRTDHTVQEAQHASGEMMIIYI